MKGAALLALALVLALAAPARADFSVSAFSAAPVSAGAGAHSNFTASFSFGGGEDVRDLDLALPPGLVGNPRSATQCSATDFQADNCAATSEVGTTSVNASVLGFLPITAPGTVYNLVPHADEPARLGINVQPIPLGGLGEIHLESSIKLRSTTDFGLTSSLRDMPNTTLGLPVHINSVSLTLNANAANGPFMTNPTSCDPAPSKLTATSYDGTTATASASFTPTGCAAVPFAPTVDVSPGTTQTDTPTSYAISVNVPDGNSEISRVQVVTPPGTNLNAPLGDGLQPCDPASFGKGSDSAPTCPDASKVGSAQIDTPLLGVLNGDVFLAAPTADNPYGVFVAIPVPGGEIKLVGKVTPDPASGQLTSVFDGLPPVPFTRFTLTFRGGDKAVLVNDVACGTQTSQATLTPFSNPGSPATPTSSFTTTSDGGGGACSDPLPFAPAFSATSSNLTAGASPHVTMTIARAAGQQTLGGLQLSLPAGLVGGVSGIGICLPDDAKTGNCPAASKVGTATTTAGAGNTPLTLGGNIYLTTGDAGSPAALLTVVPARVGPYDFGNVILKSNISVRPSDAGFDVSAPSLPQILGGIPLRLRGLSLTLDRDGFLRNPTNCGAQSISARFTSPMGGSATATAPYTVGGCDTLAFAPRLTADAGGKGETGRLAYPGLTTMITQAPTEAATKTVTVSLPASLSANTMVLGVVCGAAQLAANSCPAASKVGEATAFTPLLPTPLQGPVYITQSSTGGLPNLTLDLHGLLNLRLTGVVGTSGNSLTTTFDGIPDVPLTQFALRFAGGSKTRSLLQSRSDLCTTKNQFIGGTFTSHSGKTVQAKSALQVEGCPPIVSGAVRSLATRKPQIRLSVRRSAAGQKLKAMRVTLPKGLTFNKKLLKKGAKITAGSRKVSGAKVLSSRVLSIPKVPGASVDSVRIALSKGFVRARRFKKKPKLEFSFAVSDAQAFKFTVKKTVVGH